MRALVIWMKDTERYRYALLESHNDAAYSRPARERFCSADFKVWACNEEGSDRTRTNGHHFSQVVAARHVHWLHNLEDAH